MKVHFLTSVHHDFIANPKINESQQKQIKNLFAQIESRAEVLIENKRFLEIGETTKKIKENGSDIVVCTLSNTILPEAFDSPLSAVFTTSSGYNTIQAPNDVIVCNTPGVLDEAVANFTCALILTNLYKLNSLQKKILSFNWKPDQKNDLDQILTSSITRAKVGFIGLGEIALATLKRLNGFNCEFYYYSRSRKIDLEEKFGLIHCQNPLEIAEQCDIVSLHCPLTPETKHLVNSEFLMKMKKGALLVNTARGAVVDQKALLDLLEKDVISINLALDVFEEEPIPYETVDRLHSIIATHPELEITLIPHNASAEASTRANMVIKTLSDVIKLLDAKSADDLKSISIIKERPESTWNELRYIKNL